MLGCHDEPDADIAPADRVLYALRDVTAHRGENSADFRVHHEQETGGGDSRLVLDVKCGTGRS